MGREMTRVGQRVYDRMKECGMNQSQLAKAIAVTPSRITKILHTNLWISLPLALRLRDVLGCEIEQFEPDYQVRNPWRAPTF